MNPCAMNPKSQNLSPELPLLNLAEQKMLLTVPMTLVRVSIQPPQTRTQNRIVWDSEFAFEIGSGLLTEVRRLQSLLAERDKALQDMKEEKDDLEKSVESLRSALKSQEQSTGRYCHGFDSFFLTPFSSDKYKEENWNLEVTLQELRIQFSDSQSTVQRLEGEHKRLNRQLNKAREATDQHKNEAERLKNGLEDLKANHETAIAQARKQTASLQRDKSDLQQNLDTLKAEMARLNRRLPRMGSPMTPDGRERSDLLTPNDREMDDVFSPAPSTNRRRGDTSAMFSADGEYDSSPDASPSRPFQAPNHPSNEVEALQQRLSHAQRQINTLKSTLQREKELKIEYRKRLDGSPAVSTDHHTEEYVTDEDTEDGTLGTGKKPRHLSSFRAGRGGRGRTRGRGGITLIQRLEHAARSLASEDDGDDDFGAVTSTPPSQAATLPVFFGGGAEADDEPEPDYQDQDEDAPVDLPLSNRASMDGLDPAFANVLRRSSSSGSIPYNRSPLRQAVVSRSVPRRSRGGAAFQEARPASLVGQPAALDAELFGTGMDSVAEAVPTSEIGCQTEFEEVIPLPIHVTPPAPETADFGVQVEQEIPEPKSVADTEMQTDPESIPPLDVKVVVERTESGVQHEAIEPARLYAESSVETDSIIGHDEMAIPSASLSVSSQAEVQTSSVQTAQSEVQTLPVPVPEKVDVETQTVHLQEDDTIATSLLPHDISDTTIYGGMVVVLGQDERDEELNDDATETGADTDTEADYQDARQSILLATPTASMEDYESIQTFSDEGGEDDDDVESIKASLLAYTQDAVSEEGSQGSPSATAPELARIDTPPPQITYESQAIQVDPPVELVPTPISRSGPEPEPIPGPGLATAPELPKPDLREISVQTDKWAPTPPASPAHPRGSSLLGFKAAGTGTQQFQYIAPLSAGPAAPTTPTHSVPPSPAAVRDSFATIIPAPRTLSHDRRQSIESTLSGADDSTPRSRIPSVAPPPVDKSRPPMMILPPPPRAPPPPNSMLPPPFIPERRIPTNSVSSHDAGPGRPTSPPPAELVQRATTPTFGSLRGSLPRQHGSSLPSAAQGLASRPSNHSFRSGAYPTVVSIFSGRDRDRVREMSTASLQSDRSLGSGRSSMSSDNHYYPARSQSRATNAPPAVGNYTQNGSAHPSTHGTDPAILHAITQTMIGEFLYKYTRRTIGKGHGERRHKRFFWVHPYTRTLYWSDADPGSSNVSESSAKSGWCPLQSQIVWELMCRPCSIHRRRPLRARSESPSSRSLPVQRCGFDTIQGDEVHRTEQGEARHLGQCNSSHSLSDLTRL
jgi:predicted  nucleic acid-binding Zn-ribbon protein